MSPISLRIIGLKVASPVVFLLFIAVTSISGCATNQTPQITYSDSARPLSQTAVVLTARVKNGYDLKIVKVDGKPTSCIEVGCPVWVRVAPGKHTVTFRYQGDWDLGPGVITYKEAFADVELTAGARHLYIAEYSTANDKLSVVLRDDGSTSSEGIYLGLSSQKYPVSFE
jgi:hypothetical protein